MTTILFTPFEAIRIAEGNAMTMKGLDGNEYECRLATPDEFLAANKAANEALGIEGIPLATMEQAILVTQPVTL